MAKIKSIRKRNKYLNRVFNSKIKRRNFNLIKKVNMYQMKNKKQEDEIYVNISKKIGQFVSVMGVRSFFSSDIPVVEMKRDYSTKGGFLYKEFKQKLKNDNLIYSYNYYKDIFNKYMLSYEYIVLLRNELLDEINKRNSSLDRNYIEEIMFSLTWTGEFVLLKDIIDKLNEDNTLDLTKIIKMQFKLGYYDNYLLENSYKK